jgi:hypothetical protein
MGFFKIDQNIRRLVLLSSRQMAIPQFWLNGCNQPHGADSPVDSLKFKDEDGRLAHDEIEPSWTLLSFLIINRVVKQSVTKFGITGGVHIERMQKNWLCTLCRAGFGTRVCCDRGHPRHGPHHLSLLPSGPDEVRDRPLRGDRPADSMALGTALEREFSPA